jgi:hypothetical protein
MMASIGGNKGPFPINTGVDGFPGPSTGSSWSCTTASTASSASTASTASSFSSARPGIFHVSHCRHT